MIKAKLPKTVFGIFGLFLLSFWVNAFAGWTEPVRISEPGGCWYPQIAAQGDTLHVVYTNTYGGDKISYVRSTDCGLTWSEYVVLSDTIDSFVTLFPRIVIYQSNILVLWINIFIEGYLDNNLGYAISENGGRTWTSSDYILTPNWELILYFAAAGSDSIVNIIFNGYDEQILVFFDVRSTDFGSSWSDPVEIFRAAENGTMDMVAFEDMVHFVWSGDFDLSGSWEIYYIRSTDGGVSWSENIPLADLDRHNSIYPSISVNEFGHLAFCWEEFKYSPYMFTGDIFIKQSSDHGENWTSEQQITFNHLAVACDVFNHNDTIHVVYDDARYGFPHRDIYYRISPDDGLTWSDEYQIENDTCESRNPAVAASNGKVYVIWADSRCDPDTSICGGVYFSRYDEDTQIIENINKPYEFDWIKAYPNPFNSVTTLTYSNLKGGEIEIFNISGQLIRTFQINTGKEGKIIWDATDAMGNKVSSGIYFARARTFNNTITTKLIFLK